MLFRRRHKSVVGAKDVQTAVKRVAVTHLACEDSGGGWTLSPAWIMALSLPVSSVIFHKKAERVQDLSVWAGLVPLPAQKAQRLWLRLRRNWNVLLLATNKRKSHLIFFFVFCLFVFCGAGRRRCHVALWRTRDTCEGFVELTKRPFKHNTQFCVATRWKMKSAVPGSWKGGWGGEGFGWGGGTCWCSWAAQRERDSTRFVSQRREEGVMLRSTFS